MRYWRLIWTSHVTPHPCKYLISFKWTPRIFRVGICLYQFDPSERPRSSPGGGCRFAFATWYAFFMQSNRKISKTIPISSHQILNFLNSPTTIRLLYVQFTHHLRRRKIYSYANKDKQKRSWIYLADKIGRQIKTCQISPQTSIYHHIFFQFPRQNNPRYRAVDPSLQYSCIGHSHSHNGMFIKRSSSYRVCPSHLRLPSYSHVTFSAIIYINSEQVCTYYRKFRKFSTLNQFLLSFLPLTYSPSDLSSEQRRCPTHLMICRASRPCIKSAW